jgi:predicted nucleic acid-binding protein
VLLCAARGSDELSARAMAILDDPARRLITSDFVRLEVLPKAICYKNKDEAEFYEAFFSRAHRNVRASKLLVESAQREAELAGLSAIDALHVAAAKQAKCEQLVTIEKSTKPLFRVSNIEVVSLRDRGS